MLLPALKRFSFSSERTTRTLPSALRSLRTFTSAFVFGSTSSLSTTMRSLTFEDHAERSAKLCSLRFCLIVWFWTPVGPNTVPPPTQIGERVEPARARPVPFWSSVYWQGIFQRRCKFEIVDLRSQIARLEADLREIRVAGTRIPIRECLTVSASSAIFRSNPRIKKTNSAK